MGRVTSGTGTKSPQLCRAAAQSKRTTDSRVYGTVTATVHDADSESGRVTRLRREISVAVEIAANPQRTGGGEAGSLTQNRDSLAGESG